jgi:hypothetical protein
MRIEIINWAKYNPRSDVSHSSWFRMENTFWFDPAISKLDNDGKMVWVMLLSSASKQGQSLIELDFHLVSTLLKISQEKLESVLVELEASEKIKKPPSRRRNAHVTPTSRPRHADVPTYERTDETDGTNELSMNYMSAQPPTPKDLAKLWNSLKSPKQSQIDVVKLKPKSKRWLWAATRLREHPDLDYWRDIIARIAKSDFCNGINDRGWVGCFEFLVRSETHIKALEGRYDNKGQASTKTAEERAKEIFGDEYDGGAVTN